VTHDFLADVRFAAAPAAQGLVAVDYNVRGKFETAHRNEEPLALADRLRTPGYRRAQAFDRGANVADGLAGNRRGEPVALVMSEQELVLRLAVADHQYEMALARGDVYNFGNNPVMTANIKEFAIVIGADIDPDFLALTVARAFEFEARAHAGEMPAQKICGRHKTPQVQIIGLFL
jgi:hypothetical protein